MQRQLRVTAHGSRQGGESRRSAIGEPEKAEEHDDNGKHGRRLGPPRSALLSARMPVGMITPAAQAPMASSARRRCAVCQRSAGAHRVHHQSITAAFSWNCVQRLQVVCTLTRRIVAEKRRARVSPVPGDRRRRGVVCRHRMAVAEPAGDRRPVTGSQSFQKWSKGRLAGLPSFRRSSVLSSIKLKPRNSNLAGRTDDPREGPLYLKLLHRVPGHDPLAPQGSPSDARLVTYVFRFACS